MRKSETGESAGGDSDTLGKLPPISVGFKGSVAIRTGAKAAIRSLIERPSDRVNSAGDAQKADSQHTPVWPVRASPCWWS